MLSSLRNRLIFSHVLPLLIIVPLMGIALTVTLETQYFIPNLSRNLEGDARLIADLARDHPEVWTDSQSAKKLLDRLSAGRSERILLISPQGTLLGSTDPADQAKIDQQIEIPKLAEIDQGKVSTFTRQSQGPEGEVIDILAPVKGQDGSMAGIVRLTYRYETLYDELIRLRYLIGSILLISLVIGVGLGSLLAVNIGRPIRSVTLAVQDLASGRRTDALPERGPDEIRQLQQAANHLVEQLHEMEESRRKLLANLVHELGRPLGALRAAIQALRHGAKDDPQLLDELLKGMEHEAILLQRVTEDLSHLHEQFLGPLELEFQVISLQNWLPEITRPWQVSAEEHGLAWKTDIPADLPAVKIDPQRFSQALGNLVDNAIKYSSAGGIVALEAGSHDQEVWLRVSDTGEGIPLDEQAKVFTPFFRGTQKRRFPQGMGLGLSIAQDLISIHGGHIDMDSMPGLGSRFTIKIPAFPSQTRSNKIAA